MDWILATEGDRLFQCGIARGGGGGGGGSSGHHCSFPTVSRGHILVFLIDTAPQ